MGLVVHGVLEDAATAISAANAVVATTSAAFAFGQTSCPSRGLEATFTSILDVDVAQVLRTTAF